MDILILQHHIDTPPGTLISFLEKNGLSYRIHLVSEKSATRLPELNEFKHLVVLGGEANVDETARFPWLAEEKAFLKRCLAAEKKILGICLGGQLLAEALGARVSRHPEWEVGWHEVVLRSDFQFLDEARLRVFQWHGYSFDTPATAELVAENSICKHQAFQAKAGRWIGLQFHPESSRSWIEANANTSAENYPSGTYVQTRTEILEKIKSQSILEAWFHELLKYWLSRT